MKKTLGYFGVTFLIVCFLYFFEPSIAKASWQYFQPINFITKTTNLIINRVSDIIYYLIMQKKYIFDDYIDPNIYPTLNIPVEVEKLTITDPVLPDQRIAVENKPIAVTQSIIPEIKRSIQIPIINSEVLVETNIPALFIKNDDIPLVENSFLKNGESAILKYTNQERDKKSIGPLSANVILNTVAKRRADDLFDNQYFDHESPVGKSASDLARQMNYDYLLIGENLALGDFAGEKGIVQAWMDSPGHRANILNDKFIELGVAVIEGIFNGEKNIIAVQIFAKPLSNCLKPNMENKTLIDSSSFIIKQMQTEAISLYENLNKMKNDPGIERSYYSQKVQEYNYFAQKVNGAILSLKNLIDIYNQEVAIYNACLGS